VHHLALVRIITNDGGWDWGSGEADARTPARLMPSF
jgi:hypothetical protein